MNKYFLPIYHSQLKPWIKFWLLKRLKPSAPVTLKAVTISSGTLTKVDKSKALSIKEYYGNTVQNGTPTPDSPVPVQTISGNITFNINSVNYNLDLGDVELCKIGDYKDKIVNVNGTWKVEKKVGKVVLNGSENWIKHGSIASWFYYDGITNGYFNNAADNFALTNYFAQKSYSSVVNLTNGEFAYGTTDNGVTHRLVCKDTNYTVTQDFKDWLSTHNTNVYYILATPTTETITNTNLISELNALYEFYVGMSTVTISNNSEIPLEVLLEYYGR